MIACIFFIAMEVHLIEEKIIVPPINYIHNDLRQLIKYKGKDPIDLWLDDEGGIYLDGKVSYPDKDIKRFLHKFGSEDKKLSLLIRVSNTSKTTLKTLGDAAKRLQHLSPPGVTLIINVAPY